ncbi:MAG: proton-conducting transporter membrane subunit [Pseudomonadota bacterium]
MSFLPFVAPALLALAAADLAWRPVARGRLRLALPETVALVALILAAVSASGLVLHGPATSPALGIGPASLAARVDVVSVTMALAVSLIGWAVLRFSRTALDGEAEQGAFMARMSITLAGALMLVGAGTLGQLALGWVAIVLGLRRLILFYPDRPGAARALRKKTLVDLVAAAALAGAFAALWLGFGTADIAEIAAMARAGAGPETLWIAAALLALAGVATSALMPFHGWLAEVMEAPTPVSAFLHAGVVSAGGFLLIRFADVMVAAPGVLAVLAMVGGLGALVGAAVALTQPTVKTALAWSTCAQMGFMVLQCGLALFPLALLHIVAHAFYKAHAFLSAGSAVESVAATRRPGPVAVPSLASVARAFGMALAIFVAIGLMFGLAGKAPQAVALGAILIFGVAYLLAQGLADAAPKALTWRISVMSVLATVAYFGFQAGAEWLTAGTLPPPPAPDGLAWAAMVLAVGGFGLVAFAQATFPLWARHPAVVGLRVHLMNGLYLNALADRMTGRWTEKGV